MNLSLLASSVSNPANRARLQDVAAMLRGSCVSSTSDRLIALENAAGASSIYGRTALRHDATLAVGNERRGVSPKLLAEADEIVMIPVQSRRVTTLNVAAAAAVAGWYVLGGSAPQSVTTVAESRRPSLYIVGDDHIEVGSTLRSAAAFGFADVLLEDRGAGWFTGSSAVRREAYAAARRHKNAIRVHPGDMTDAGRFREIVVVHPAGEATPIKRVRLTRGPSQLVLVGGASHDIAVLETLAANEEIRIKHATLEVAVPHAPLRLVASIALAEIARQVGRPRRLRAAPPPRPPIYEMAVPLRRDAQVLVIEHERLLGY